jgi:hypothetical protein
MHIHERLLLLMLCCSGNISRAVINTQQTAMMVTAATTTTIVNTRMLRHGVFSQNCLHLHAHVSILLLSATKIQNKEDKKRTTASYSKQIHTLLHVLCCLNEALFL